MELIKTVVLASLLCASASASATLYQFSYAFNSGAWTVSGTFDGTAVGDLIQISEFESLGYTSPGGAATYSKDSGDFFVPMNPGSFTTFSGTSHNFEAAQQPSDSVLVVAASGSGIFSTYYSKAGPLIGDADATLNSSWRVVALPVPEPSASLMLLAGLGVFGCLARRRK